MRFLFIGPGYPGAEGTSHGSGIGTYLREITLGLGELGHECHVVAWSVKDSGVRVQGSGVGGANAELQQRNNLTTQQLPSQDVNGIKVFLLPHAYWPIMERFMPDSRDVWNMRQMVKRLDREYQYDWIEIQSEEGIGIGVQKDFPDKSILRAHTTLLQMVEYKGAGGIDHRPLTMDDRQPADVSPKVNVPRSIVKGQNFRVSSALAQWKLRYRLRRERRSFQIARRIVTHSKAHAEEIKRQYPGIVEPAVVWHGVGAERREELLSCRVVKLSSEACEASAISPLNNATTEQLNNHPIPPTFLIIGTPDRRKGFDRIRPVLEAYAAKYGPCRCVIVGGGVVNGYSLLVNGGGRETSDQIEIEWKSGLSAEELAREYDNASVYLHLARYESFGVPLIEAAAHGVPIVSTRVGIAPELIKGDLSACLVNGDDPGGCARSISRAIQEQGRYSALLLQCYKEQFSRKRMSQNYLAWCDSLVRANN